MDHVAPPEAIQAEVAILENRRIARDTFRLRLDAPAIARAIRPGQFVMVRPGLGPDPLLGRPFAFYDIGRDERGRLASLDVVYLVLGRGTAALATRHPGDRLSVWGPLGNGFGPPPDDGPSLFVAGGIGQTPFVSLAKWWAGAASFGDKRHPARPPATLLYGVRSAEFLAGMDDFRDAGVAVEVATDDGSAGHRGFVTDLLRSRLDRGDRPAKIVACGPPPMLAAVARIAEAEGIACDLSMENHMACGFGACFSCVSPIRQEDGSIDLRRVCVEGPIFAADQVVFA